MFVGFFICFKFFNSWLSLYIYIYSFSINFFHIYYFWLMLFILRFLYSTHLQNHSWYIANLPNEIYINNIILTFYIFISSYADLRSITTSGSLPHITKNRTCSHYTIKFFFLNFVTYSKSHDFVTVNIM